jgi:hypothetical protein
MALEMGQCRIGRSGVDGYIGIYTLLSSSLATLNFERKQKSNFSRDKGVRFGEWDATDEYGRALGRAVVEYSR